MPKKTTQEEPIVAGVAVDWVKTVLAVLLFVSLIASGVLYWQYRDVKKVLTDLRDPAVQQAKIKTETAALISRVGQLMVLPEGEPTVATVIDSETLAKEQSFFRDAHNGDKVLIYKDKAILYDEANNRIVNVGPVVMAGGQAESGAPVNLEIRNGSKKIGAANDLGDSLKKEGWRVASVGNAVTAEYPETVIVNLTGRDISALAQELQAKVTDQLPDGEATSSQDAVIILGNK